MAAMRSFRDAITPLSKGGSRPLWSVMIPTYNSASYLRRALASVLAQDPGPEQMQIEVVDDCSTGDDPGAVVAELGGGRVGFYRRPQNVGHVKNFNTCLQRSQGKLVHLLHSDDCVRPGFYQRMQLAFAANHEIGAAFCRHIWIDEQGHWQHIAQLKQAETGILKNWLEVIAAQQPIQTPAIVARRDVYERLGGFDDRMASCGEDWEMWVRIAAHYAIWYEAEPLALYRMRSGSLSARSLSSGENVKDLRRAIEIYRSYLPAESAAGITAKAHELVALWAIKTARQLLARGERQAALVQVREAIKTSRSINVILQLVKLGAWFGERRVQSINGSPAKRAYLKSCPPNPDLREYR
jgi:hypothetical protein